MTNNSEKFEYQEYFIFHNNSIVKFTICKTNQEIMIKSNNYEVKLNHQNIENLINMKFDNIEKDYNYILNLFQQNSIMIKDIIINKSMILSFIQNGKMREIILLYNNESKSSTHYELNYEFKNLMNDIAQIKKDVHDIHNAIHNNNININQNNNNINKNNIFDYDTKEFVLYNDFVIDRTIAMLDNEMKNQEKYLCELGNQCNEYMNTAVKVLKEKGDKEKSKKLLIKKKKCQNKMNVIQGIIAFMDEQITLLDNAKLYKNVLKENKMANKVILDANINQNLQLSGVKGEKKFVKEDKKEQKQSIEDNEIKFEQSKEEGYKALKEGILAIIFSNEGVSLEGLKKIQLHFDKIRYDQEELNQFFKDYADNDYGYDEELDLLEKELSQNNK